MKKGYWVIRTYQSGAIGEKTKYWVSGEKPSRSKRVVSREVNRLEKNETLAVRSAARVLNANFKQGDILLGLDYSEEGLLKVLNAPSQTPSEPALPKESLEVGLLKNEVKEYIHDDNVDNSAKCVVVDWYYKIVNEFGKDVLHYCKFVGDTVLFATENEERYRNTGLYAHGKYPFVLDVLYPEADTPAGFGIISITKDPQMYIDKLQQFIIENAAYIGKPRYWCRKDSGINEDEFLDMSKTLVHVEGSIDEEKLRRIEVDGLPAHILNLLQFKIDELKDTSSNHDVNQGQTASGVTSGAAIAALQETGNKTSRDMLAASYRAYTQVVYLVIELIRQFYDEARSFRITGNDGQPQYIRMGNEGIKGVEGGRKPIFDVVVKPQKRSAYSKLSQNDLMIQMYQLQLFHPQNADAALIAVEGMEFDGKQKMLNQLQQGQTMFAQMQQMGQQIQAQSVQMEKMAMIIEKLTGQSVGKQPSQSPSAPALP